MLFRLNISVKQGISYRDAVTQVKKEEKTQSTSTSSDITQQTAGVQGAKKATSAVASGTKTIKTVPVCNKTDRIDHKARTSRQGNTDVGVRGKQINLCQYVDSIHGRRSTTRRSNVVPDNYNGTALLWVVRNIQPTSGQLQVVNQLNTVWTSSRN